MLLQTCASARCRGQLTFDASAANPIVALTEIAHIVAERMLCLSTSTSTE